MARVEEAKFGWRREAPLARAAVRLAFAWHNPGASFIAAAAAAAPFAIAAAISPALLTLRPTAEMLAPIAEARAVAEGAKSLAAAADPLMTLSLIAADMLADTPGRIHLAAKAIAAATLAVMFASLGAVRFPLALNAVLAAGLAGVLAAPYSGGGDLALGALFVAATALLASPAEGRLRLAVQEGVLAATLIFALWLSHPAAWIAGVIVLCVSPFLSERAGLARYAVTLGGFLVLIAAAESVAPGLAHARADRVAGLFAGAAALKFGVVASGGAVSAVAVVAAAAVFGGAAHARASFAGGLVWLCATALGAALGVDAALMFVLAASLAAFSVASPFYDGLFEAHDRATVAASGLVATLTFFAAATLGLGAAGNLELQARVAAAAPSDLRAAFALAQPQGPQVARWIEEGRFSTPEARAFFALSPADQSEAFLSAARAARAFADKGLDVAILTAADAGCVLVRTRNCHADGLSAAGAAEIVFVPRLDLDPETAAARGRSEAMLYSEFRLAAETPFWDIWVKRGAKVPAQLLVALEHASPAR